MNREPEPGEDGIEPLLKEVGVRGQPSAAVAEQVRAAVHAEWRSVVAQRTRRKRTTYFAIAAGIVCAVVGTTLVLNYSTPGAPEKLLAAADPIATVAKIEGDAAASVLQVSSERGGPSWRDVSFGESLAAGVWLRTDASTSVALRLNNDVSVRIDRGSLFQLAALDRAEIERGRIYVDAPPGSSHPLVVHTRFGAVEHLGTQYQVQMTSDRLFVSVREGRVSIGGKNGQSVAVAGERVELAAQGEVGRSRIAGHDASWAWASRAAPQFDIADQTLAQFLDWVARETGRTLRYATPELRKEAEKVILQGSIRSLSPEQALPAVLATTTFRFDVEPASIEIRR